MLWYLFLLYFILCQGAHLTGLYLYLSKKVEILRLPQKKWQYYLLSFTWGLPLNLIGLLVAGVLYCFKKRPKKWGWNWYFELPVNFGAELGIFSIVPEEPSDRIRNHEFGHSIQNIYYGPLMIGTICIPSFVRFWIREIQYQFGYEPKNGYDDIWFEGQATRSGAEFIKEHKDN